MYHPWRALRETGDWLLGWGHLDGAHLGLTHHEARTIVLDSRLTQVERRCTVAHELVHRSRGPVPAEPVLAAREEEAVSRECARLLISVEDLADALAWSRDPDEVADELWVDRDTLEARLRGLRPAERSALRRRLENHE